MHTMWSIRAPVELKARVDAAAAAEGISSSAYVKRAVETWLEMGADMAAQARLTVEVRRELQASLSKVDELFAKLDAKKPRKRK